MEGTQACVCSESRLQHALPLCRVLRMETHIFFQIILMGCPTIVA